MQSDVKASIDALGVVSKMLAECGSDHAAFLPPGILIRWIGASALAVAITILVDRIADRPSAADSTPIGPRWKLLPLASATIAFFVVLGPMEESRRWFESCYMPITILPAVAVPGCVLLAAGPMLLRRLRSNQGQGRWAPVAEGMAAIALGVITYSIGLRIVLPLLGFPTQLLNLG